MTLKGIYPTMTAEKVKDVGPSGFIARLVPICGPPALIPGVFDIHPEN